MTSSGSAVDAPGPTPIVVRTASTASPRPRSGGRSPGRTSVVLIGDLAFVHDSSALVALAGRGADLRVVVVDNDGGGIFSFLPQATALTDERFEQLFGTPLGVDIVALAAAHGLPARSIEHAEELIEQLAVPGPWIARVPSNRQDNVVVHDALHAAVRVALDGARS